MTPTGHEQGPGRALVAGRQVTGLSGGGVHFGDDLDEEVGHGRSGAAVGIRVTGRANAAQLADLLRGADVPAVSPGG